MFFHSPKKTQRILDEAYPHTRKKANLSEIMSQQATSETVDLIHSFEDVSEQLHTSQNELQIEMASNSQAVASTSQTLASTSTMGMSSASVIQNQNEDSNRQLTPMQQRDNSVENAEGSPNSITTQEGANNTQVTRSPLVVSRISELCALQAGEQPLPPAEFQARIMQLMSANEMVGENLAIHPHVSQTLNNGQHVSSTPQMFSAASIVTSNGNPMLNNNTTPTTQSASAAQMTQQAHMVPSQQNTTPFVSHMGFVVPNPSTPQMFAPQGWRPQVPQPIPHTLQQQSQSFAHVQQQAHPSNALAQQQQMQLNGTRVHPQVQLQMQQQAHTGNAYVQQPYAAQPLQYTHGSSTNNSNSHAMSVKIRPPPMDKNCIDLWFFQLDSWFANNNIHADQIKFNTLIGLMDTATMVHVYHVVANPPLNDTKYAALREELKKLFSDSMQQRYQKLINAGELGVGQKPSMRLNQLRRFAEPGISDQLLKQIWMSQLPREAQGILLVANELPLEDLARKADDIVQGLTASRVAAVSSAPQEPKYVEELRAMIEKLSKEVKASRSRSQTPGGERGRSKSRSTSEKRETSKDEDLCYYHNRFGDESRNCRKTCKLFDEFQKNSKNV